MNVQEMKRRKQELGYSYARIARLAGVSIATVKKIFGGEVENPRYETLQKIEAALCADPQVPMLNEIAFKYDSGDDGYTMEDYETFPEYASVEMIRGKIYPRYPSENPKEGNLHRMTFDELVRSPRNGSYTYSDYLKFPDELRVEIVRGRIYAMAAPTVSHQVVTSEVCMQISQAIRSRKGKCMPFISPIDVQLWEDGLTVVQPDVIVVCDKSKIDPKQIIGAPDFVLEVLSPSTAAYDKTVKLEDYREAGVKELWIVDYEKGKVFVHWFGDSAETGAGYVTRIYSTKDVVPMQLFDGEISVDFGAVSEIVEETL